MATDIDSVLNEFDDGRRDFLRKLIRGAAFAPPLLASFSLQGLLAKPAEGVITIEILVSNQCLTSSLVSNQSGFVTVPTFDFSGTQYEDHFLEVLRPDDMEAGLDLAEDEHPALNITGLTGAGGSTWATLLQSLPPTNVPAVFPTSQTMVLQMDFLIHRFNNAKGAGLLAYAFNLVDEKGAALGLALVVSNAGNTDRLQLMTVEAATGKVKVLKNASLGASIAEDAWYRLELLVQPAGPCTLPPFGKFLTCPTNVQGRVFRHQDPEDPNSPVDPAQVGDVLDAPNLQLNFSGFGRTPVGQVGIVARAVSAVVDSSVTNFTVRCSLLPPP